MKNVWKLVAVSCPVAILPMFGKTKYLKAEEIKAKPKILIVGAGLTGCLTSYLIRFDVDSLVLSHEKILF